MKAPPHVVIYTDGSCEPNPGPGGWAAILRSGGRSRILTGGERETTNNRMELTAVLQALQALTRPCRVDLYTDSEYVQKGITAWLPVWKEKGWKRKDGRLANLDLWQALDAELGRHEISWHWVKGHARDPLNRRVDGLARAAIPR